MRPEIKIAWLQPRVIIFPFLVVYLSLTAGIGILTKEIIFVHMALSQYFLVWLLHFFVFIFDGGKKAPDALIILNLLAIIAPVFGAPFLKEIALDPVFAHRFFVVLTLFLFLVSPISGALYLRFYGKCLFTPFSANQFFEPSFPFFLRMLLAFFALTILLPMGGLAIPCWFWVRLHIWPRYQKLYDSLNDP